MTPASILQRFPRYQDRVSFHVATGRDAPAFDKAKQPKLWADDTLDPTLSPDAVVSYKRLPRRGEALALVPFAMNALEASSVNLPGLAKFPAYVVAPTVARTQMPGHSAQGLDAELLSTTAQASAINEAIGGSGIELDRTMSIDYGFEERRIWNVRRGTTLLNVGKLLMQKYNGGLTSTADSAGTNIQTGVGAGGRWDLSQPQVVWIPDTVDLGALSNDLPELDPPVRDLRPGEALVRGITGLELTTASDPAHPSQLPDNFEMRFAALEQSMHELGDRLKRIGI